VRGLIKFPIILALFVFSAFPFYMGIIPDSSVPHFQQIDANRSESSTAATTEDTRSVGKTHLVMEKLSHLPGSSKIIMLLIGVGTVGLVGIGRKSG
jgi:hypothetical protein